MQVFSFCCLVFPFREWNKLKTYHCIAFTAFEHSKIYPFQYLSLGFILDIFLKFDNFQPRYCYKLYSHRKKECIDERQDTVVSDIMLLGVYFVVKTCEVFLCFLAIICLGSILLISKA